MSKARVMCVKDGKRMELYNGRPENIEGRLPREIRTYDFLDKLGIEYLRTDHEPANNMEACNEIEDMEFNREGITERQKRITGNA